MLNLTHHQTNSMNTLDSPFTNDPPTKAELELMRQACNDLVLDAGAAEGNRAIPGACVQKKWQEYSDFGRNSSPSTAAAHTSSSMLAITACKNG